MLGLIAVNESQKGPASRRHHAPHDSSCSGPFHHGCCSRDVLVSAQSEQRYPGTNDRTNDSTSDAPELVSLKRCLRIIETIVCTLDISNSFAEFADQCDHEEASVREAKAIKVLYRGLSRENPSNVVIVVQAETGVISRQVKDNAARFSSIEVQPWGNWPLLKLSVQGDPIDEQPRTQRSCPGKP